MTLPFRHTDEAQDFINSADSRETSREIMEAIIAFSNDLADAEYIWEEGLVNFNENARFHFINTATRDGRLETADLYWGAAGNKWTED